MMLQLNCRGGTTFTQSTQSLHVCNMRCLLYDKTREVLFSKHPSTIHMLRMYVMFNANYLWVHFTANCHALRFQIVGHIMFRITHTWF